MGGPIFASPFSPETSPFFFCPFGARFDLLYPSERLGFLRRDAYGFLDTAVLGFTTFFFLDFSSSLRFNLLLYRKAVGFDAHFWLACF